MVVVASFRQPESPIKLVLRNVRVILDKKNLGAGTLFISERTFSWQKEGDVGFSMDYFNISLHAVSKDPNVYQTDCIYILTDPHIPLGQDNVQQRNENEDDSDAESEPDISELLLVPETPTAVQQLYESIRLCQELNPDPVDVEDDDDDEDILYEDAEEQMYIEAEPDAQGDVVENLAHQFQNNSVSGGEPNNHINGNDDEEFQDAD